MAGSPVSTSPHALDAGDAWMMNRMKVDSGREVGNPRCVTLILSRPAPRLEHTRASAGRSVCYGSQRRHTVQLRALRRYARIHERSGFRSLAGTNIAEPHGGQVRRHWHSMAMRLAHAGACDIGVLGVNGVAARGSEEIDRDR